MVQVADPQADVGRVLNRVPQPVLQRDLEPVYTNGAGLDSERHVRALGTPSELDEVGLSEALPRSHLASRLQLGQEAHGQDYKDGHDDLGSHQPSQPACGPVVPGQTGSDPHEVDRGEEQEPGHEGDLGQQRAPVWSREGLRYGHLRPRAVYARDDERSDAQARQHRESRHYGGKHPATLWARQGRQCRGRQQQEPRQTPDPHGRCGQVHEVVRNRGLPYSRCSRGVTRQAQCSQQPDTQPEMQRLQARLAGDPPCLCEHDGGDGRCQADAPHP